MPVYYVTYAMQSDWPDVWNENGIGRSPDHFSLCGEKLSVNKTTYRAAPYFLSIFTFNGGEGGESCCYVLL